MTKLVLALSLFAASAAASADQFKTVKEASNANRLDFSISYPQFFANSVPAYQVINTAIRTTLVDGSCGEPEPDETNGYNYNAEATVVALNKRYVGIQIISDDYCGGAHPNYGIYHQTYDAQTGAVLDIAKEFGFLAWNDPAHDDTKQDAIRLKLAKILVDHLGPDNVNECYEGTREEKIQQLVEFWPMVHGLAKNKTVVLGVQPPHVATPCRFEARVDYNTIKSLLNKGSYLHQWLK